MGSGEVTDLLMQCRVDEETALMKLLPLVYDELRKVADNCLRNERADHTLQSTALVHEAYMRLVDQRNRNWENRRHFLSIAATAMRRILIHHAERHRAKKRGGGKKGETLFEASSVFEERAEDVLALDEALSRLLRIDEQKAKIVELRFFAGLSVEETAQVVDVSARTIERDWRLAKAWLRKEIQG